MPGYIQAALVHFKHTSPNQPEHAPYNYLNPTYSRQPAKPIPDDTSSLLQSPQITRLQQIIRTLLYNSRAVDPIILAILNDIIAQQTNDTEKTSTSVIKLLNFCAIYTNASPFSFSQRYGFI